MVIFHSYVKLPEGKNSVGQSDLKHPETMIRWFMNHAESQCQRVSVKTVKTAKWTTLKKRCVRDGQPRFLSKGMARSGRPTLCAVPRRPRDCCRSKRETIWRKRPERGTIGIFNGLVRAGGFPLNQSIGCWDDCWSLKMAMAPQILFQSWPRMNNLWFINDRGSSLNWPAQDFLPCAVDQQILPICQGTSAASSRLVYFKPYSMSREFWNALMFSINH